MATTCQLLLRGLDGRTSCLRFPSTIVTGSLIQDQIASILRLPAEALLIITGTTLVYPNTSLSADSDGFFPSCTLLARLRGGKGGFGSLLRGAATKAGQKKTSNFDACRDMSGRRLRHVNAEKKLKEWKGQAKERELEKAANEYLKKQVKQKEDDSGCSEVIEKFREDTFRAREDVESAVARGLAEAKKLGKRKVVDDDPLPASSSKRANVWLDTNIDMNEDDSEDERDSSDDDNDADDTEEGSEDEDAKAEEGSEANGGAADGKPEEGAVDGKPEEVFEYAKVEEVLEIRSTYENTELSSGNLKAVRPFECEKTEEELGEDHCSSCHIEEIVHVVEVVKGRASSPSASSIHGYSELHQCEGKETDMLPISNVNGNGILCVANDTSLERGQTEENLNLDDFLHASDLEVLGLERLKHELQTRGLKCGGSLAERAGRLFLLKTVPLQKLDKKHFAKARA